MSHPNFMFQQEIHHIKEVKSLFHSAFHLNLQHFLKTSTTSSLPVLLTCIFTLMSKSKIMSVRLIKDYIFLQDSFMKSTAVSYCLLTASLLLQSVAQWTVSTVSAGTSAPSVNLASSCTRASV